MANVYRGHEVYKTQNALWEFKRPDGEIFGGYKTQDEAMSVIYAQKRAAYDERCSDLAEVFLGDEHGVETWTPDKFAKMKHELAQTIQEAIEDWLSSKRQRAKQAELNGNPDFPAGSCAYCGKFHSSSVCP